MERIKPEDCEHKDCYMGSIVELRKVEPGADREFNVQLFCNDCEARLTGQVRELD